MNLLFIDDDPKRLIQLKIIFINNYSKELWESINIKIAHGFEQIEYLLSEHKFDLIMLDGDMPLMSGVDVAKEFLTNYNSPIIIHTLNFMKAKEIAHILKEYEVPHIVIPITDSNLICKVISKHIQSKKI